MVFEKVLKGGHAHSIIGLTQISVGKSCLVFGRQIIKDFKDGFVEVYIDRSKNLVGFKPSNNMIQGYKIHKSNNTTGIFAKEIEPNVYDATLEDGIWAIKVPKISDDILTVKTNGK